MSLRVCLVYDRLYPLTLGGAERWYRHLADALAERGFDVTYATLRQWDRSQEAEIPGAKVITLGPRLEAYTKERRRILPPIVFGLALLAHLIRHGRSYDVVHMASFPYFSVLAAAIARRRGGYRLVVDWHEIWTRQGWREYAGPVAGRLGWAVQRLCLAVPHRAFTFSRLHAGRLTEQGLRGRPTVLTGEYAGPVAPPSTDPPEPHVVFAGRHIPEKRATAAVEAAARAREQIPELRCSVFGDGPQRADVIRLVHERGLSDFVAVPGFVDEGVLDEALRRALCLLLPSSREGYGLVVIEASARGTPSIVVEGPENAAVEYVEDGVNGVVAPSASPEDLAAAIHRIHEAGDAMRRSTATWFEQNARRLSLEGSLDVILPAYRGEG